MRLESAICTSYSKDPIMVTSYIEMLPEQTMANIASAFGIESAGSRRMNGLTVDRKLHLSTSRQTHLSKRGCSYWSAPLGSSSSRVALAAAHCASRLATCSQHQHIDA